MKNSLTLYFFIISIFITTTLSAKTIYYVTQNGTGSGTSWATASGNIQTMIDKAVSGDEVWVAKGTYYPTTETIARDPRSRTYLLKDGVNLYGGFSGNEIAINQRALIDLDSNGKVESFEFLNTTLLSGDIDGIDDVWLKTLKADNLTWKWSVVGNEGNSYRVVTAKSVFKINTFFNGFSVTGGNANASFLENGGGVFLMQNSHIENCIVFNCFANASGGGIDCTPYSSYTANGRGVGFNSNSYVNNSLIKNCFARIGGGIASENGSSNITNCIVLDCSSSDCGGGIYSFAGIGSFARIDGCFVSNCISNVGGGIFSRPYNDDSYNFTGIYETSISISNCSVNNCMAEVRGGGICATTESFKDFNYGHSYTSNCLVTNCSAPLGGGIYSFNPNSGNNYTIVLNCTVSNCSATDGGGIYDNKTNIKNCILSNCFASNRGSGIFSERNSVYSYCAFSNCDRYPQVPNGSDIIMPETNSIFINPTNFIGVAKTELQKNEILSSNWHLCKYSPCIDNGVTNDIPSFILIGKDNTGNPRILYNAVDLGAFEFNLSAIQLPIVEDFNSFLNFNKSASIYGAQKFNTLNDIKWKVENQRAEFSWQTNLTSTYSESFITYPIDATKATKVLLRYWLYFEAYSGTISPLGTEKLKVEYSKDFVNWFPIVTYSNLSTIPNKSFSYDISGWVAGKTFFLRFNATGENSNRIEKWVVDNIIVDTDGLTTDVKQIKDASFLCTVNNGILNIQNLTEPTNVQLFDVNGRLLIDSKSNNNSFQFALPVHGVYIIRTKSQTGAESRKVVW